MAAGRAAERGLGSTMGRCFIHGRTTHAGRAVLVERILGRLERARSGVGQRAGHVAGAHRRPGRVVWPAPPRLAAAAQALASLAAGQLHGAAAAGHRLLRSAAGLHRRCAPRAVQAAGPFPAAPADPGGRMEPRLHRFAGRPAHARGAAQPGHGGRCGRCGGLGLPQRASAAGTGPPGRRHTGTCHGLGDRQGARRRAAWPGGRHAGGQGGRTGRGAEGGA